MKKYTWKKGRRRVRGTVSWSHVSGRFMIVLDARCPYSGEQVMIVTSGDQEDEPNFNGWRRV